MNDDITQQYRINIKEMWVILSSLAGSLTDFFQPTNWLCLDLVKSKLELGRKETEHWCQCVYR